MPRGRWTAKDDRMYDKIFLSCRKKKAKRVCYKIAAATVNKHIAKQCRLGKRKKGCTTKLRGRKAVGLRGTRRGISIDREHLDRGGYTSSGRYFGVGAPLYAWWHEASGEGGYVRAGSAKEARVKAEKALARFDVAKSSERNEAFSRTRG